MIFDHGRAMHLRRAGRVLVILSFFILPACSAWSGQPTEQVAYEEITRDSCHAYPENAYHILIPKRLDRSLEYPLLIVLDAHGDGLMAVENFQPAVRHFPCLVVGSDLIRNNFSGFESAIRQLIDDLLGKYPVDRKHMVISGFSGGARMAYCFALRYPVSGVLMCGAGPGAERPSCPVYTLSGMGDFNFAEQYVRPDLNALSNDRYTSDYFHGIHEWPAPSQLEDALNFLFIDLPSLKKARQIRSIELLERADSLTSAGDEIMAWKAIEKSSKIAERSSVSKRALLRAEEMLQSSAFQEAIRTLETDLTEEMKLQQEYPRRLLLEDEAWWKKELNALNSNFSKAGPGLKKDHYLRVKGYIGILLYSLINRMIHDNPGDPQLQVMLDIYAYAEPENPDVYFFRALDAYRSGDRGLCTASIEKSLELGFSDRQKLNEAFPASILQSVSH